MPKMNEQVFNSILEHIEIGKSLRSALKVNDINSQLFYDYMDALGEGEETKEEEKQLRVARYVRAKKLSADYFADEIVEIADTEKDTNKARIRIDARKWVASKLKPKSYGDLTKHEHTGEGGGMIQVVVNTNIK